MKAICYALLALLGLVSEAHALCIYGGVLNAPTTLEREFGDSSLVVLATVQARQDLWASNGDALGILYRIKIDRSFKGSAPEIVQNYTDRDSGGFYLDVGKQYLLFLNPIGQEDSASKAAPGALRVNYSCGQSRLWAEIPADERDRLTALSTRGR
jgi:hypothetical protein